MRCSAAQAPCVLRTPDFSKPLTPLFVAGPGQQHVDDQAPPPNEQAAMVIQLRQHLGPIGYRWLGACAFFPAMTASIALYFGQRVLANPGERAQLNWLFAQLSGLPWMRYGHMPYWLRRMVIGGLSEADQRRAREIAASILQASNLSRETPRRSEDTASTVLGGGPLVLPIRVADQAGDAGLQIDDLAIELLAGGTIREIDPIMQFTEEALRKLLEHDDEVKASNEGAGEAPKKMPKPPAMSVLARHPKKKPKRTPAMSVLAKHPKKKPKRILTMRVLGRLK